MIAWLEDQLLRFLQRRCQHPGKFVIADCLEGDVQGLDVKWCRRCGAILYSWNSYSHGREFRYPDPNMYRG